MEPEINDTSAMTTEGYLKKITHNVTVNGTVFKVRELTTPVLIEVLGKQKSDSGKDKEDPILNVEIAKIVVKGGLVEPAFSDKFTVDDIPIMDLLPLSTEIFRVSRITTEEVEKLESFLQK